ncbi:cytochrome c maturation protein CcmE [Geoglobus acetivorans]|uniref:Cytochrome c maturation protein CcmE n=1 Tax=Geoglobus acetivorans TaxID=565033 RepID=A0ABZ3H557_GEOAI|nr:cytochrome c maturation protein CcmE [Geoglobus acetivorans]
MVKSNQIRLMIGISLIGFSILVVFAFNQGISPYLTVSEVVSRGTAENVQVNGTVVQYSLVEYENGTKTFRLTDGKNEILVVYNGSLQYFPGEDVIQAVVKGDYRNGVFYAEDVLMKCPSKYEVDDSKLKR